MKKLFTMALAVGMLCNAQAADLYKASRNVALRAPAVPLITSDPYLSIWSPTDALNESSTMHWTGTEHPLLGAIRVDGKTYRFMGKDKLNLETLVPMTHLQSGALQPRQPNAAIFSSPCLPGVIPLLSSVGNFRKNKRKVLLRHNS